MEIQFNSSDLRPLIEQIVAETIAKLQEADARADDRIAFREAEAAAMLPSRRLRSQLCHESACCAVRCKGASLSAMMQALGQPTLATHCL